MIAALLDHLWQSTLFAGAAGVLALALRHQAARVRYWLWLAASAKFLIPFSLLVCAGTWLAPRARLPEMSAQLTQWVGGISTSALAMAPASALGPVGRGHAVILSLGLWLAGTAAVATLWGAKWLRMRSIVKAARAVDLPAPVPVRAAPTRIEPGLVGIRRPVILLPEGLAARLSPAELRCVIAHEVCHLRRRDNLTAAMHMAVEAIFWFYPLTWWLGSRLLAERELACDESVIASGHDRRVYAEGLLKVCRLYIGSPMASAAGASGADLKRRIAAIMTGPVAPRTNGITATFIALTAVATVAAPLLCGFVSAPPLARSAAAVTIAAAAGNIAHPLPVQMRLQRKLPSRRVDTGSATQRLQGGRRGDAAEGLAARWHGFAGPAVAVSGVAAPVTRFRLQQRIESELPPAGAEAPIPPPALPAGAGLARPRTAARAEGYSLWTFESLPFVSIGG
jgi:beta-lactamase regulating signal transducer with metallopeptidase domain